MSDAFFALAILLSTGALLVLVTQYIEGKRDATRREAAVYLAIILTAIVLCILGEVARS